MHVCAQRTLWSALHRSGAGSREEQSKTVKKQLLANIKQQKQESKISTPVETGMVGSGPTEEG